MSISRKSSFDTVVVDKARDDPLQFLSSPGQFRKDLDLKGLSESARKSFLALKPWQTASQCFFHPSFSSTIIKVTERLDECHEAIKATLAVAQMGRSFSNDVAALCAILAQKQESPDHLDELLSKLITTAQKGYGRSIQAQGQLICARHGLSHISENIPPQVSKIREEYLNRPTDPPTVSAFNGLDTCFVTLMPPATTDDEETDIWKPPMLPQTYQPYNYLTFQNVITQLNVIAADILQFTEQSGRCVEWWKKMKGGMEILRASLHRIIQGRLHSINVPTESVAEGWESVADQFTLYIHKTSLVVKDYYPNPYVVGNYSTPYVGAYPAPLPYAVPPRRHRRRSYSPRRSLSPRRSPPSTPSPVLASKELPLVTVMQEDKSKPLWKKLSCLA